MIFVYGDESMDETRSRVCAVAGVVGTEAEWQAIEPIWTERNGSIPFHAKDCESDQGDYKPANHGENQNLYRDLVTIIARSSLRTCLKTSEGTPEGICGASLYV
jgi:hypothetical protein